jgi:dCMP deaminase
LEKEMTSWDRYFFDMATFVSTKSKDKSTKVGAVIVGPDNEIRSSGYNGFPRGVDDDVEARHERPLKYTFVTHAELNSLLAACRVGIPTKDCRMYVTHWPCAECSKAIIQAGIKEVIAPKPSDELYERWKESMDAGLTMFREANVTARTYEAVECE